MNFNSFNNTCAARLNTKDWRKRHTGSTDVKFRQKFPVCQRSRKNPDKDTSRTQQHINSDTKSRQRPIRWRLARHWVLLTAGHDRNTVSAQFLTAKVIGQNNQCELGRHPEKKLEGSWRANKRAHYGDAVWYSHLWAETVVIPLARHLQAIKRVH